MWDAAAGVVAKSLIGHSGIVTDANFSPDGSRVATASDDRTVRVWAVNANEEPRVMLHPAPVNSAVFSADTRLIATGADDGHVRVWEWARDIGKPRLDLAGHRGAVNAVAFNPGQARFVASVGWDGIVRYWNLDSAEKLWERSEELRGTAGALKDSPFLGNFLPGAGSVAFSPDGVLMATSHDDAVVRIMDTVTGRKTALELSAPSDLRIRSAEFSADGKFVVAAGGDGKVRIWEADTGDLVMVIGEPGVALTDAAFSSDSRSIVTAGMNGDVSLYRCEVCGSADALLALAADRITRSLNPEERERFLHEPSSEQ